MKVTTTITVTVVLVLVLLRVIAVARGVGVVLSVSYPCTSTSVSLLLNRVGISARGLLWTRRDRGGRRSGGINVCTAYRTHSVSVGLGEVFLQACVAKSLFVSLQKYG